MGLAYWVDEAPSALMQEFARIALAKSYSLGQIARKLGGGLSAGNVTRHFSSDPPRDATVERYMKLLGVPKEYAALVSEPRLKQERLPYWRTEMERELFQAAHLYESDPLAQVKSAWDADPQLLVDCAVVYALTHYRQRFGLLKDSDGNQLAWLAPGWPVPFGLLALAEALKPVIDLRQNRRRHRKGDRCLSAILSEFHELLDQAEIDALLTVARSMLRAHGYDLAPMERSLTHSRKILGGETPTNTGAAI